MNQGNEIQIPLTLTLSVGEHGCRCAAHAGGASGTAPAERPAAARERTRNDPVRAVRTNAFSFEAQPRPGARVTDSTGATLEGFGAALTSANWVMRRKRELGYRLFHKPGAPEVVAEGDSWFQHPLVTDLIDHLSESYNVSDHSAAGDEIVKYTQELEFIEALNNTRARILLLSGGGNDLFAALSRPRLDDRPVYYYFEKDQGIDRLLKPQFYQTLQAIVGAFERILNEVRARVGPHVTVITHTYDYLLPDASNEDGWLGYPLYQLGIVNLQDQVDLIGAMVNAFAASLQDLASRWPNFKVVDTRGALDINTPDHWSDEIHPSDLGFAIVAQRIRHTIDLVLAGQ